MDLSIQIILIAIGYSIFSILIQRIMLNQSRLQSAQIKTKQLSKEMDDLIVAGASNEKIDDKRKEVMKIFREMTKMQMKPIIIVFIVFGLLYYLGLPFLFGTPTQTFTSYKINYQTLFIFTALIASISISVPLLILNRRKSKTVPEFR